jgi:hypothetical protein
MQWLLMLEQVVRLATLSLDDSSGILIEVVAPDSEQRLARKSGVLRLLSCGKRVINKVVIFNLVIIKPLSKIESLLWMRDVRSDTVCNRDSLSVL